ncbi:MAG: NUDIX hydrolase [Proteobacteria bacterium]|nr:NUDIX hydrolase [Pseudomonadota bacterium]
MRELIKLEVESINAIDEIEETTKTEVINWINSGVELCRTEKPDVPRKHLVSYFVLVDGEYILLVDHINAQLWLPTGGHVEPEEHPRLTVLREASEELSIQGEFLQEAPVFITSTVTVGKTAGHTDISFWYILKGNRSMNLTFDQSEFNSVKWFHKDNVPLDRTDPELGRFLKKLYD